MVRISNNYNSRVASQLNNRIYAKDISKAYIGYALNNKSIFLDVGLPKVGVPQDFVIQSNLINTQVDNNIVLFQRNITRLPLTGTPKTHLFYSLDNDNNINVITANSTRFCSKIYGLDVPKGHNLATLAMITEETFNPNHYDLNRFFDYKIQIYDFENARFMPAKSEFPLKNYFGIGFDLRNYLISKMISRGLYYNQ